MSQQKDDKSGVDFEDAIVMAIWSMHHLGYFKMAKAILKAYKEYEPAKTV